MSFLIDNLAIFSRADKEDSPSSGSSPPVVVAFLCVGMFGVGIIAILGWKRQFNRLWYTPVIPTASAPDSSHRPELWDVWIRRRVPGVYEPKKPLCGATFDGQPSGSASDVDKPHCQEPEEDTTQLQLAFVIVMPRSPPTNELLEYSIGICRVPWHRDEG